MKYLIKIVTYLFIFLMMDVIITSCNDPLDQDPVQSITEETIFSDIDLIEPYLNRCYELIVATAQYVFTMTSRGFCSETDETVNIHGPNEFTWVKGTMNPSNFGFFVQPWGHDFAQWDLIYQNIKNVNVLLDKIDEVPVESSTEEAFRERMKAEAYWIRAFMYTNLLRCYGGLILMDKPFELGQDYLQVKRSTLKETMDFILSDIDKAISGLPQKDQMEQGRANQGTAAALKVRLLTFCASPLVNGGYEASNPLVSFQDGAQNERWAAARDAAKALMDGNYGSYGLTGSSADPPSNMTEEQIWEYANNFQSVFIQKGAWNSEIIWGIQFSPDKGYRQTGNTWQAPNGYRCFGSDNPQEPFVRSFEMADGTKFIWDQFNPGNDLVREATAAELENTPLLNPYNGREPRFYASIMYHGQPWRKRPAAVGGPPFIQTGYFVPEGVAHTVLDSLVPGLDTRDGPVMPWNGTKTGYYIKKFLDPTVEPRGFYTDLTWMDMRYAEVLMNYAEACIELGDIQNGIDALNEVRNRAGLPDRPVSDQTEAREFARHERSIEFFAEAQRWFDIRRWMIAPQLMHDVYPTKIYEWTDGNMRWEWDKQFLVDERSNWHDNLYWLPIPFEETQRAPQIQQNPSY